MEYATISNPPLLLLEGRDYDLNDNNRYTFDDITNMLENERNSLGIATVVHLEKPPYQRVVNRTLELVDNLPTWVNNLEPIPLEDLKNSKLDSLANKRWEKENAGMMFGMAQVATDDRSKLLAFAASTKAKEDSTYTKRWKIGNGQYTTLEAGTLVALADALEYHVAICFGHEETLASAILNAQTYEELDAVDINVGWPS